MARINSEIIKWARDTAGLDPADAANKLGLKAARGIGAEDRLLAIEAGDLPPTRRILSKMSKLYRRPLLIFYLPSPPRPGERGQDFRTLPAEYSRSADALVDALVRDITARQQITRAILLDEEDAVEFPFVGSMTTRNKPQQVLASISETLRLDLTQYRNRRVGDKNSLSGFNYLRRQAEKAGFFVLLIGNLGSHHTSLDVEVFRGFALADKIAPFIVINDQDSETSWSFTLLHELAHIWLGQTGVSGDNASATVEQFCNEVASEFLIPKGEIREIENFRQLPFEDLVARIRVLAEEKNVSMSMLAYKLLREDIIKIEMWRRLSTFFRKQWLKARQDKRDNNKDKEGGPNYYTVKRHRLGEGLVSFARRSVSEGVLSPSKAGKLLGVKPTNVYTLLDPSTGISGKAA